MNFGPMPKIIDFHVHIYPEAVAAKVASAIGLPEEANHPERLVASGIVAAQKAAGISLSVNLPVATRAEHVASTNAFAKNVPDGIISFAALHPDTPDKAKVIGEIAADGFKGIKFHPEFQGFALDDPRMDEVWRLMAEHGLIAVFHAGGDRSYEPPYRTTPALFREFAGRHPGLKIVAAHMGGYQMWYQVETDLAGQADLYLDTSWLLYHCDPKQAVRMIRRHGVDKVLYASDSPWRDPAEDVKAFLALPLTEEEKELVLHKNAERLLRLC